MWFTHFVACVDYCCRLSPDGGQLRASIEVVAQKLEGKVRVLKIDSDAEPDVSNTLQIRGLPTILLINDMSVIMRVEGALEANELLQLVDHYLFGGPPPQLGENLESVGPTQ